MRILILGASGMLGYSLFKNLSKYSHLNIYGTVRSISKNKKYFLDYINKLIVCDDAKNLDSLVSAINECMPDIVINCIGLIKQNDESSKHTEAIEINALLPHKLAGICNKLECKLIHFSTDCCFDGKLGAYTELDEPNAIDLYGRTKALGEIGYSPHLTLRTSIIGHELNSNISLINWFLSQENEVNGFSKAIFSGLPTSYIADLLCHKILPKKNLTGIYNLSADPIDKYSLLLLVSKYYKKNIKIHEDKSFSINRSLDSTYLRRKIKFIPDPWPALIEHMYKDFNQHYNF